MSGRNRQLVLLVVLIVAFALLLKRQLGQGLGGAIGPAGQRPATAAGVIGTGGEVEIAELRLEALEHKPATYQPGRDPFRFAPKPEPPPPPRPKPAERPPRQRKRPAERPAEQAPPAPQPPPVEFTYLGSFGLPGREIAVFSDGNEILNAFAGDVLQGQFVVRSIGYESADIGYVDFPDAPAKRLAVGG